MTRRTSNPVPTSLKAAFDADKAHALRHRRFNIERLAELMGTSPATLYKWLETDTMPLRSLLAWQHLTGACNVVRYLASREGLVVIRIPQGRRLTDEDVLGLQEELNASVGALIGDHQGRTDRDTAMGLVGQGLEGLAWHQENLRQDQQPQLDLEGE